MTRYLDDGTLPIEGDQVEILILHLVAGKIQLAGRPATAHEPAGLQHHEPEPAYQASRPRAPCLP